MPDMHGLGDVGAAEIHDHALARAGAGKGARGIGAKRLQPQLQHRILNRQIEEAGSGDGNIGKHPARPQPRGDFLRDGARIGFGKLGRGERAIALELREVGTVGKVDLPQSLGQTFSRERLARDRAKFGDERGHLVAARGFGNCFGARL